MQDGAAGNASLEVVDLASGLVDVEGADHNEARWRREVALWDWNLLANVLADNLNVVLELRGDGNNGRILSNGTCPPASD